MGPEPEPGPETRPESEPAPIADADLLFREGPDDPGPDPPPAPATAAGPGETYDLGGEEPPAAEPTPPVTPAAPPSPPRAEARRPAFRLASDEPAVEVPWSRWLEWGPDIARVGAAFLVAAFLVWFTFSVENLALSLLAFAVLMAVPVVLSYPILITLERPVRVIPEQAVRYYFGALSHHVPHYRRMWHLLGRAGQSGGSFASFEGFRAYWRRRLAELRGPGVSSWTPLQFEVTDFKSGKSVGQARVGAKYTVAVFVRGRRASGPIHTARIEADLVRGPDNLWYLEDGRLP